MESYQKRMLWDAVIFWTWYLELILVKLPLILARFHVSYLAFTFSKSAIQTPEQMLEICSNLTLHTPERCQ